MNDLFAELGLRRVINGTGYATVLGASPVSDEVIAAVAGVLTQNVEMIDLQRAASEAIAVATGAEAGCVTACAASGIAVGIAAAITGDDLAHIEALPDGAGVKNEVVIQKAHCIDYSGNVTQMIRIAGAKPVEIGSVNGAGTYHLEGAIGPHTAAGLFVVSAQAPQGSFIGLGDFVRVCHAEGVPVIVDAATDYDLRPFIDAGADLVVWSGHKRLGGLTAGVVAGKRDLVRAAYMQERGIGRAMKVGKEGVVGVIAALKRMGGEDQAARTARESARIRMAVERLSKLPGFAAEAAPDPTGKPLHRARIRIDADKAGISAHALSQRLAAGDPTIKLDDYEAGLGVLVIEPTCLSDKDMETICARIAEVVKAPGQAALEPPKDSLDDRRNRALLAWPRRRPGK